MSAAQFEIGTRVMLVQPYMSFPAGTCGTIVRLYRFDAGYCGVRFDSSPQVYPIHCDRLAVQ